MLPLKVEARAGMVRCREAHDAPRIRSVTRPAAASLAAPEVELSRMRIAVTRRAGRTRRLEEHGRESERSCRRPVNLAVTIVTRDVAMSSLQRKRRALMPFDRECRSRERILVMAGRTIRRTSTDQGLPRMGIRVAPIAAIERRLLPPCRFLVVASFASNVGVTSAKRETRLCVVEALAIDVGEIACRMTPGAPDAQLTVVRIRVTGGALAVLQWLPARYPPAVRVDRRPEPLGSMTRITGYLAMSSRQRIARRVVIEADGILPPHRVVALFTPLAEHTVVDIEVARLTCRLQPDVATGSVFPRRKPCDTRRRELGIVTSVASELPMGSIQPEGGLGVIEAVCGPFRPGNQSEVAPRMVGMTLRTITDESLPTVQPSTRRDRGPDLPVTLETATIDAVVTLVMTGEAIEGAIEGSVCLRQRTGGHLGHHPDRHASRDDQHRRNEHGTPRIPPSRARSVHAALHARVPGEPDMRDTSLVTVRTPVRSRKAAGGSPPMRTRTKSIGNSR